MRPSASVILSTYNAQKHLALVLAGLQIQTEKNFELHIADDGSTPETSEMVETFMDQVPFSVIYSWQQDLGFRKTKILNKALRKAKADYCIFLDGDCIPHKDFVRNHIKYQKKGHYLAGRRVELGPEFSEILTPEMVLRGKLNRPSLSLLLSCLRKDSGYWHRSFPVYHSMARKVLKMEKVDDLKGCNFSVDRESLLKINGFDEAYEGYGREDTDVELRLQYLGLKIKSLKGLAIQYHLWHERLPLQKKNDIKVKALTELKSPICKNGIVKIE